MIKEYFTYIVVCLLIIIICQGFFNSPNSHDDLYRERIDKYKKEKIQDLKKIDSLNREYEIIEKNISIDSLNIWTYDRKSRDSIRAILNPK